ncbi:hypothetical protein A374_09523 [Fictibacillus macauensis ZFHKF-1]|uniref:Uncharacterized protein n=1 Tax=Fictibacillus macauensis ZFHKF-1 TaxID=1196324 RepID=I8J176_9BACL|nr:hypothetical protein A374_09523 [Fictibacillus macauensis ZFHKF-1]
MRVVPLRAKQNFLCASLFSPSLKSFYAIFLFFERVYEIISLVSLFFIPYLRYWRQFTWSARESEARAREWTWSARESKARARERSWSARKSKALARESKARVCANGAGLRAITEELAWVYSMDGYIRKTI